MHRQRDPRHGLERRRGLGGRAHPGRAGAAPRARRRHRASPSSSAPSRATATSSSTRTCARRTTAARCPGGEAAAPRREPPASLDDSAGALLAPGPLDSDERREAAERLHAIGHGPRARGARRAPGARARARPAARDALGRARAPARCRSWAPPRRSHGRRGARLAATAPHAARRRAALDGQPWRAAAGRPRWRARSAASPCASARARRPPATCRSCSRCSARCSGRSGAAGVGGRPVRGRGPRALLARAPRSSPSAGRAAALVGGGAHALAQWTLRGLFGRDLEPIVGGVEGLVLGAATGLGYALATRGDGLGGLPSPRGAARWRAALVAGLLAARGRRRRSRSAGGHLGALSLDLMARSFPGSQVGSRTARPPASASSEPGAADRGGDQRLGGPAVRDRHGVRPHPPAAGRNSRAWRRRISPPPHVSLRLGGPRRPTFAWMSGPPPPSAPRGGEMAQSLLLHQIDPPGSRAAHARVELRTERPFQLVDVTTIVAERVRRSGVWLGTASVQSLHTTAARRRQRGRAAAARRHRGVPAAAGPRAGRSIVTTSSSCARGRSRSTSARTATRTCSRCCCPRPCR